MFFRQETDGTRVEMPVHDLFGSGFGSACWMIGGGPSLADLPIDAIAASPAPKFAVNLSGSKLLRPNFWTSYDPTARFHRSVYLDASIIKFVQSSRAMDLVPETTFKVCDCPSLLFFERDRTRGFARFPSVSGGITDWQDSFIQAIDLAYRLGFRELLLAGCDMAISPSAELLERASDKGVTYQPRELLGDFITRCERAGLPFSEMERIATGPQYHFDETKSLRAAIQTDFHYFRVAQYLRLARRPLATAGLRLISVSPGSRLNDDFPFEEAASVCRRLCERIGSPADESTRGRYSTKQNRTPAGLGPMRDFRPHFWNSSTAAGQPAEEPLPPPQAGRKIPLWNAVPETPIVLNEEG